MDAWTFLYLGGDSYPACTHVEDALRDRLVRPGDRFVGQEALLEFHEDGVWVRDIARRVAGLQRLLAQLDCAPERTVAIGRSAGARVVTRLAAGPGGMNRLAATVCLAYPFQAPGGPPEPGRFAHLAALRVPTLLLQGKADAWGSPAEARNHPLPPALRLRALPCDHHTRLPPREWDRVAAMIEAFLGRAPAVARAA
jgi:predicted alpha/beta-hydrolase family hydrolase